MTFDPNVRLGRRQTFVGFEDVRGEVFVGSTVDLVERESQISGSGRVTSIDAAQRLVYIDVDWSRLSISAATDEECR